MVNALLKRATIKILKDKFIGYWERVVARVQACHTPGCGFKSDSYPCLWEVSLEGLISAICTEQITDPRLSQKRYFFYQFFCVFHPMGVWSRSALAIISFVLIICTLFVHIILNLRCSGWFWVVSAQRADHQVVVQTFQSLCGFCNNVKHKQSNSLQILA